MLKFSKRCFSKIEMPKVLEKYKKLINNSEYVIEDLFPRQIKTRNDFINYASTSSISPNLTLEGKIPIDSINSAVFTPCWDLLRRGGKKWRPIFGLILADYYNLEINNIEKNINLYKLLALTELIHNASLIIDDVEDKSEQRRDEPCIHIKYGEDISINAGISMLYFPIHRLINQIQDEELRNKVSRIYLEEMTAIHIGQGWDIEMKVGNRIPSVENYKDTVICKTGVCLRLVVKLINALIPNVSGEHREMIDIADNISIAFQIKDDLLNICDSLLSKRKGFVGEDIWEGKLTLMVIHTLSSNNGNRLRNILSMKTKDQKLINEAIEIMRENKSIAFADNIMKEHMNKAILKCENLKRSHSYNADAVVSLQALVHYLIDRNI
jgi:geranylgeranyl diphosphate synthase type 3/geranylgeranyl diphosphate synthase type I